MHVSKSEVATLKAVSEFRVVHAEEMQNGGMEIVDGNGVPIYIPGKIISRAIHLTSLDATASHPKAEGARVVVSTGDRLVAGSIFPKRCSTEFAAPDDKRGVQQTALFEVFQQGSDRLVDHLTVMRELGVQIAVMIPGGMDDIHKAHTALDHPARLEAMS